MCLTQSPGITRAGERGLFTGAGTSGPRPNRSPPGFSARPPLLRVQLIDIAPVALTRGRMRISGTLGYVGEFVMLALGTPDRRSPKTLRRKKTSWGYRWGYFAPHRKINHATSIRYIPAVGPSSATIAAHTVRGTAGHGDESHFPANACARSAIRSEGSSSPICSRTRLVAGASDTLRTGSPETTRLS